MKNSHLLLLALIAAGLLYFHFKPEPPALQPVVEFIAPTPTPWPKPVPEITLSPGESLPTVTMKNGRVLNNVIVQRREPDGFLVKSAQGAFKIYRLAVSAEEGKKLDAVSPSATPTPPPTPNAMNPQGRFRGFSGKKSTP